MRVETITRNLFQFDELSEEAKEKARDWYREFLYMDDYEFDFVIDDAKAVAALMGIEIDKVYYDISYSQGSGACFEGTYSYKKGSVKAVKKFAPQDEELHRIAEALQSIQKKNAYKLEASVKQVGRYSHANSTEIDVDLVDSNKVLRMEDFDATRELLRDFMNWIYRQLQKQDEYINSNESIDENIRANEYEFLENGKRA